MGIQEGEFIKNHYLEKTYAIIAYPFVVYYPGVFVGDINWRSGFMKSFIDTDLREIREKLPKISTETLVLHGSKDKNIEPWVAEEHSKLLPNSELVFYNGTHVTIFSNTTEMSSIINYFLLRGKSKAKLKLIVEE